jgi:hypothetical protein
LVELLTGDIVEAGALTSVFTKKFFLTEVVSWSYMRNILMYIAKPSNSRATKFNSLR